MDKLNPNKLHTYFLPDVSKNSPIEDRHYTITHSDVTGDIYLDVGSKYNIKKINFAVRDDVLANWVIKNDNYVMNAYCFVGNYPYNIAKIRYEIFKKNLGIAFTAIRYGDAELFKKYSFLNDSEIFVHFESTYSDLNENTWYGKFKDYEL